MDFLSTLHSCLLKYGFQSGRVVYNTMEWYLLKPLIHFIPNYGSFYFLWEIPYWIKGILIIEPYSLRLQKWSETNMNRSLNSFHVCFTVGYEKLDNDLHRYKGLYTYLWKIRSNMLRQFATTNPTLPSTVRYHAAARNTAEKSIIL